MAVTRSRKIVLAVAAWAFALMGALAVSRVIDFGVFFNLGLIGFLVILGLSGPFTVKPRWRSRAGILIALGALIFLAIILQKIYAIGLTLNV